MSEERYGLDDLLDEERLAFGALLRAVVSMDAGFSDAEKAVLEALAEELGPADFWETLHQASAKAQDVAAVLALAQAVERPKARELLVRAVEAAAQAGGLKSNEALLLEELRRMWGLAKR